MTLTTARLKATLRRNEPAGANILKTLSIVNCMKYLLFYAGLQNGSPTQPSPFDRNTFNGSDHGSNSDTVRSRKKQVKSGGRRYLFRHRAHRKGDHCEASRTHSQVSRELANPGGETSWTVPDESGVLL